MTITTPLRFGLAAVLTSILLASSASRSHAADWLQFRGPDGAGRSDETGLPVTWSSRENLIWKKALPGFGASSPITVGDRIFVTCYSGYGIGDDDSSEQETLRLHLVCLNRDDGEVRWQKALSPALPEQNYRRFLPEHGYASSTPAADGEAVYAFFGRSGVFAFDLEGKELWHESVGSKTHGFGTANSPVVYKKLVIINASVENGHLVALDKKTGKEVWSAPGMKRSWNTPLLVAAPGGKTELVVNTAGYVLGFDPDTGKRLWTCAAIDDYICPSVIAHEGVVFAIGGRKAKAVAVRVGGRGEVTESHRLWVANAGSNVPSPVYHDDHLYWVNHRGIAHCVDAKTGKVEYQERLAGGGRAKTYASAVLADGRLYVVTCDKGTFVLEAKPEFKQVAHNVLGGDDSIFNASPVVSRGQLLLKSDRYLYCVGTNGEPKTGG